MLETKVFSFADWDVDGSGELWNHAQPHLFSLAEHVRSNDQIVFAGRSDPGFTWYALSFRCPYVIPDTGDARDVPFHVVSHSTRGTPAEVFDSLLSQCQLWLQERVAPTIRIVRGQEAFSQWVSWVSRQRLKDSSVMRDLVVFQDAAERRSPSPGMLIGTAALGVVALGLGTFATIRVVRTPAPSQMEPTRNCLKDLRSVVSEISQKEDQSAANIALIADALRRSKQQLATPAGATALQSSAPIPGKNMKGRGAANPPPQGNEQSRAIAAIRDALKILTDAGSSIEAGKTTGSVALSSACEALLSQ